METLQGIEIADLTMRFEMQMRDCCSLLKEAQSNLIDIYTPNPSLFLGAAFRWIPRPRRLKRGGVVPLHQERETAPEWRSHEALQFSRNAMFAKWAPAAA